MESKARIVHQTRDRLRLRVPERRGDIHYFMDLYEDLHQIPGITDVVINPRTSSVLLLFPGATGGQICDALRKIGLLPPEDQDPRELGRIERFLNGRKGSATNVRAVLLLIMIGIAIPQLRRGKIVAPALSVLWYAYDLVAAHKREKALLEAPPEMPSTQSEG